MADNEILQRSLSEGGGTTVLSPVVDSETVQQALGRSREFLGGAGPDGELLLAQVLRCPRATLRTWPERRLTPEERRRFNSLVQRRRRGEPVAYILGRKAFWTIELQVDRRVLVPRPETELLVELALELFAHRRGEAVRAADLGTGSGAIALALAGENPAWRIAAVDISREALDVAQANALGLGLSAIEFHRGSWCGALPEGLFDLILSNPPYVAAGDACLQGDGLAFEPRQALVSGGNGLADLECIIAQSKSRLKKDAWLLLEHGHEQGEAVASTLRRHGYINILCRRDLAGHQRVSGGQWPAAGGSHPGER